MSISSPSLAQILPLSLLYNSTTSLSAFSYLLSFQRHESTCRIFKKLISWPLLWILLPPSLHPKFPILLLSSSLPLFFLLFLFFLLLFFSFSFSLLTSFLLPFLLPSSVSATLTSSTLVSTVFHTLLGTLSSLLLLSSSQSQNYDKQAIVFPKSYFTSDFQSHQFLFSFCAPDNKY